MLNLSKNRVFRQLALAACKKSGVQAVVQKSGVYALVQKSGVYALVQKSGVWSIPDTHVLYPDTAAKVPSNALSRPSYRHPINMYLDSAHLMNILAAVHTR
eukprot:6172004-Pleurochrysis_carterae.AAC.1